MHDPAPYREPQGNERWMLLGVWLVGLGALIGIVVEDYEPARLAPVFMLLAWFPLIALHELGHAFMARVAGWRVEAIVIGFGRPAARFYVWGVPVTLQTYPLGGYMTPVPTSMRRVRLASALVYAAGPGAELALVSVLLLIVGPSALLERSDALGIIAAQSVAITALLGAGLNLVPRRIQTERGQSVTDGMGIVSSFLRPEREYWMQIRSGHEDQIIDATSPEAALQASEEAYRNVGDDAHLRSVMVAALQAHDADVSGRKLPPKVLSRLGE